MRTIRWVMALLWLLGSSAWAGEPEWAAYLVAHLQRCPAAAAEDVYKFVHQSVYGPAHAIPDAAAARVYLEEELAALPPGPSHEPAVEELSADLVRVNLRPFVTGGGDREALLAAFVASAAAVQGSPELMRERLTAAVHTLDALARHGDAQRLETLARKLEGEGFPALHHSDRYCDAYHPAYRVVLRSRAKQILPRHE